MYFVHAVTSTPNRYEYCAPESSIGIPILPLSVPQEVQVNLARVVV